MKKTSTTPILNSPDMTSAPVSQAPAPAISITNNTTTSTNLSNTGTTSTTPSFSTGGAWNSSNGNQTYDAYLNFGASPYAESSSLTTGSTQPWYNSPAVTKFFGGSSPNSQQQASFENLVLQDVQHTFALSNLFPKITLDSTASANHMMSVVSGASYGPNPNAIGITDVGHNGFNFIDKFSYATSTDQLAMALAKNMSHELMHAFGVGTHPDTTGNYIDAGTVSWNLLTSADSTFSPAAASLIAGTNFGSVAGASGSSAQTIDGQQQIMASPVPEPMTMTLWAAGLAGIACYRRLRRPALAA